MITLQSKTHVAGISGSAILECLLTATDAEYQRRWPGVHLQLHTIRRHPDNIGNVVHMDEWIGLYRLKATAVVVEVLAGKKIVWQFKKGIRLPVWLSLTVEDDAAGLIRDISAATVARVPAGASPCVGTCIVSTTVSRGAECQSRSRAHRPLALETASRVNGLAMLTSYDRGHERPPDVVTVSPLRRR